MTTQRITDYMFLYIAVQEKNTGNRENVFNLITKV